MKVLMFLIALAIGGAAGAGGVYVWMHGAHGNGEEGDEILHYRHPHDSSITSDEPQTDSMGMDYIPVYKDEAGAADGDDEAGAVRINPSTAHNLGLRQAPVEKGDLTPEVNALGFIDYDEAGLEHTHVRTEAWVEDLQVRTTGETVESGQILFRIDSPRLRNAQEELLQAYRRDSGINSARLRLRSLGMHDQDIRQVERDGQIMRLVPVRAQRGGVVRELNLAEGMFVMPGDTLIEIADLSQVWVMIDLFEADMDLLEPGQSVAVSLPFRPGTTREAELEFVYPDLDTNRRVQQARLTLDNPDGALRPGMYARTALSGETLSEVLHVPTEAVIRTGRSDRIVVITGDGQYQVREVDVGRRVGDRYSIREGLEQGEEVVVSGQFLIDSESSTVADLDRLAAQDEDEEEVWTRGSVDRVADDGKTAMLKHEPVPEWDWPEMTMQFHLPEDLDPELLEEGKAIRFRMREHPDEGYEVTAMEADDNGEDDGEPEHEDEHDDEHEGHDHGSRSPDDGDGRGLV